MSGPFLTALDSRGAVKGSRDPLGAQSIWVRFGRYAVVLSPDLQNRPACADESSRG